MLVIGAAVSGLAVVGAVAGWPFITTNAGRLQVLWNRVESEELRLRLIGVIGECCRAIMRTSLDPGAAQTINDKSVR